eukprot:scaffold128_cov248-Pinguiococcus_pyrenoidosus.AAC.21
MRKLPRPPCHIGFSSTSGSGLVFASEAAGDGVGGLDCVDRLVKSIKPVRGPTEGFGGGDSLDFIAPASARGELPMPAAPAAPAAPTAPASSVSALVFTGLPVGDRVRPLFPFPFPLPFPPFENRSFSLSRASSSSSTSRSSPLVHQSLQLSRFQGHGMLGPVVVLCIHCHQVHVVLELTARRVHPIRVLASVAHVLDAYRLRDPLQVVGHPWLALEVLVTGDFVKLVQKLAQLIIQSHRRPLDPCCSSIEGARFLVGVGDGLLLSLPLSLLRFPAQLCLTLHIGQIQDRTRGGRGRAS